MFVDRLTRAARPCSQDKLCAEEKALGELDKPSQDPGATSDLSAFHSNARCALLMWLQEQGGTSIPVSMRRGGGCLLADAAFAFLEHYWVMLGTC